MFILDSLMIAGIRWTLKTVLTAADAERNDDSALREQLLEAEMRRELGEIDAEEFRAIEADLVARIRDVKARREGASGVIEMAAAQPIETTGGNRIQVDASIEGDFYEPGERSDRSDGSDRSVRTTRTPRTTRTIRTPRTSRTTRRPRTGRTTE